MNPFANISAATQTLPAIVLSGIQIPQDADLLSHTELGESFFGSLDYAKKFATNCSAEEFRSKDEALRSLGRYTKVSGEALYYPFGGVDTFVPFKLSDQITDVVSTSCEKAGRISTTVRAIESGATQHALSVASRKTTGFDSHKDFKVFRCNSGCDGMMLLAAARILFNFPDSKIDSISTFDLSKNGDVVFRAAQNIFRDEELGNFVISFSTPNSNVKKRFWYVQHFIAKEIPQLPEPYLNFIYRIRFQTTLMKAIPYDLFSKDAHSATIGSALLVVPSKRNMALIISDKRQTNTDLEPERIEGITPKGEIHLKGCLNIDFGYSKQELGDRVYFGPSDELFFTGRTPLTLLQRVLGQIEL